MSYILEALKKAQAERQLGTAPSIHTMPIPTASHEGSAGSRLPLLLAGGGVLLALAAGAMWWRQGAVPAAAAAPAVLAVTPAPAPAVIVVPPSPQPAPVAIAPAPAVMQSAPAAMRPAPAPVATAPAPAPASAAVKTAPKPVVAQAPAAAPADAASAPDESVPFAAQLPEQIQRELPRVAFGGYMYSKNPADRLILIDNVLRHEGQEVAPGLILEQLQPRAAVLNYRGTRYRVAY